MSTGDLISVLVPAYNHERFVSAALQSLMAQTYQALELIVIDDGSSDGTYARIEALLPQLRQRFRRVEALRQENQGGPKTIVRGLEIAASDVVYMLDSDDVAHPDAIDRLLPLLLESPERALAVGDNEFIDGDGKPCALDADGKTFHRFVDYHTRGHTDFDARRDFGSYGSLIAGNYVPNGWLLRKRCWREVGGYDPDYLLDDWSLLLRLVKKYRIAFVPDPLAKYRLHPANVHRVHAARLAAETLRLLLNEHAHVVKQGFEDEWWSHASQVLSRLTKEDLSNSQLSCILFPELAPARVDVLKTLLTSLAAAKEGVELTPPRAEAVSVANRPRIHLYALCWNDVRVLGFFFRHYDPYVDRYVIFDDGSTDGSLELLRAHPKVEVRAFVRSDPTSFIASEREHYDRCWKESRGSADWVIVVDVDEHLDHPDLLAYLSWCQAHGVTAVPALGYEMQSEEFPTAGEHLATTHTRGAPDASMSKLSIFSPNAIEEIHYAEGGHRARPTGTLLLPPRDEVMLFHYKLLGMDYTAARFAELRSGLGGKDVERGWGSHYRWSRAELLQAWEAYRTNLVDIRSVRAAPWRSFPVDRWWADLPRLLMPRTAGETVPELRQKNERLAAEKARGEEEVARLDSELLRLNDELANARIHVTQFEQELARVVREREAQALSIEHLAAEIAALRGSVSWRLTAPLRAALEALRAVRG